MKVDYQTTSLSIDAETTAQEYEDLLSSLGTMSLSHQWWMGDALVFGENHYGEEFPQLAEASRLEPRTLTNYRWIADAVKPAQRRDDLSFSHHAEVARLKAKDQKQALERAAKEAWSVRQLRDFVALKWPQGSAVVQPSLEPDEREREEVQVNRRLEKIELAVDAGAVELDDVRWLLALARRVIRG